MSRIISAFKQFLDGAGDPLSNGWCRFLESGTNNTDKDTFADVAETIANDNPLQLDAEGRCPSVFGSGSYRVVSYVNDTVLDQPGQQIQQFDPVGNLSGLTDFSAWNNYSIYSTGDIVRGSDDNYYSSLTTANQGNDPTTNPAYWEQIETIHYYNQYKTYAENDIVRTSGGGLFRSVSGSNLNNSPQTSPTSWYSLIIREWNIAYSYRNKETVRDSAGYLWTSKKNSNIGNDPTTDRGVNWKQAIDMSVVQLSGGAILEIFKINQIQDSGTYTLPSAVQAAEDGWIIVEITDKYKLQQPTVQRSGSDTITDSDGTDTEVLFNTGSSIQLRFTSDGVSDWEI